MSSCIAAIDDTILALDHLQRQICSACADGWRPARPIARGGQPPTLEPPFHVDRSKHEFVYDREAQLELEPQPTQMDLAQEPIQSTPGGLDVPVDLAETIPACRRCRSNSPLIATVPLSRTTHQCPRPPRRSHSAYSRTGHGGRFMPAKPAKAKQPAERPRPLPRFSLQRPLQQLSFADGKAVPACWTPCLERQNS